MTSKIWLSSPHMGGEELKYVHQAFDENWVAPLGPNVNGLETDIEAFLQEDVHVAVLSSGTAALHLALILLGVKAGDDVMCQSFTFSATAIVLNICMQILSSLIAKKILGIYVLSILKKRLQIGLKKEKNQKQLLQFVCTECHTKWMRL